MAIEPLKRVCWFVLGALCKSLTGACQFSSVAASLCLCSSIVRGTSAVAFAAFAMVAFVGIFMGGTGTALRMCSLHCALLCVLGMIASSYPSQSDLMLLSRKVHELNRPVHVVIDALNLPTPLHQVISGPGDAIVLVAAARHMAVTWQAFLYHMSMLQHLPAFALHQEQGVQDQQRLTG